MVWRRQEQQGVVAVDLDIDMENGSEVVALGFGDWLVDCYTNHRKSIRRG